MGCFFTLKSAFDTRLLVHVQTRWLTHARDGVETEPSHRALMFQPTMRPDLAFLVGDSDQVEMINPQDGHNCSILAFRSRHFPESDSVALCQPLLHKYVTASQIEEGALVGAIGGDESAENPSALWKLEAVTDDSLLASVRQCATEFELAFDRADLVVGIIDRVSRAEPSYLAKLLASLPPLLTLDQLEQIGREVANSAALLKRLMAAFPKDPWICLGLAGLAPRAAGGFLIVSDNRNDLHPSPVSPGGRHYLEAGLDGLADLGYSGRHVSFGHLCNSMTRQSVRPTKTAGILATARREGTYLLEWLAYHRSVGFERFFIYSNNNDDGSDALLRALADGGVIHWIDNDVGVGAHPQSKAYGHAFSIARETLDVRWLLTIDIDEFFVYDPALFSDVKQFLAWQEVREVEAIALNWVMIGSAASGRWSEAPVTRRLRRKLHGVDVHIKTFSRPHKMIHSTPHFPRTDDRRSFVFRNSAGDIHRHGDQTAWVDAPALSERPTDEYACIYHYFFKSAEEFLWKFARNRGDVHSASDIETGGLSSHFINAFMSQHHHGNAVLDDRIDRCAPALSQEMERLLWIPGVAEAQQNINQNYRKRIEAVKEAFATAPSILAAGEMGREMLRLTGFA